MPGRFTPTVLNELIGTLTEIRQRCLEMEKQFAEDVGAVAPDYRNSARNLLHYLGLRHHDLRELQRGLTGLGLSSLGRTEAHTLAGLDAVLAALHRMAGTAMERTAEQAPPVDFASGPELLARHAAGMLGRAPQHRSVRIMVTMPSEAATDYDLVCELLSAGMNVMRINCAHDGAEAWLAMVDHLRRATEESGLHCRVLMDLAGPKLRTGPIGMGHNVARWSPARDARGRVVRPARIWITSRSRPEEPPAPSDGVLLLPVAMVRAARRDDHLQFVDARGLRRKLRLVCDGGRSCWAEAERTAYVAQGAPVRLVRGGEVVRTGTVGPLPLIQDPIVLRPGDRLVLTRDPQPGRHERRGSGGEMLEPARIPCTLPEIFDDVRAGERIFFDDGKIGGIIRRVDGSGLEAEITQAREDGARLRADKGINLPDSDLRLDPLTEKDLEDLRFAAQYADMVGYSFVRRPEDVLRLERELADCGGGPDVGILLKIENRMAFENLPRLLLTGLQSPPVGVMVARGDLGVEVGLDRLAEVQEEILWLCEAAHVPVIWATQVLESLAKKGVPSRAEVTDAAMSGRAECVMLNKGPHITGTVRFLDNILRRMQEHQEKKRAMLRKLSVSNLAPLAR